MADKVAGAQAPTSDQVAWDISVGKASIENHWVAAAGLPAAGAHPAAGDTVLDWARLADTVTEIVANWPANKKT